MDSLGQEILKEILANAAEAEAEETTNLPLQVCSSVQAVSRPWRDVGLLFHPKLSTLVQPKLFTGVLRDDQTLELWKFLQILAEYQSRLSTSDPEADPSSNHYALVGNVQSASAAKPWERFWRGLWFLETVIAAPLSTLNMMFLVLLIVLDKGTLNNAFGSAIALTIISSVSSENFMHVQDPSTEPFAWSCLNSKHASVLLSTIDSVAPVLPPADDSSDYQTPANSEQSSSNEAKLEAKRPRAKRPEAKRPEAKRPKPKAKPPQHPGFQYLLYESQCGMNLPSRFVLWTKPILEALQLALSAYLIHQLSSLADASEACGLAVQVPLTVVAISFTESIISLLISLAKASALTFKPWGRRSYLAGKIDRWLSDLYLIYPPNLASEKEKQFSVLRFIVKKPTTSAEAPFSTPRLRPQLG